MGRFSRAFTLIELMVSLAVTLIVSAAVLEVYALVSQQAAQASRMASLERDGQRLMDWFERDFSYFGNGVPRGCYQPTEDSTSAQTGATCANSSLIPALRRADPTHLVFVGDLPLPNAELNGAATLTYLKGADSGSSDDDEIAVSSDLSGCTPPKTAPSSGNYTCSTSSASLLQIGTGTANCDQSNIAAVTCPWGLNKWFAKPSEYYPFVIGYPSGKWTKRLWNGQDGGDSHLSHVDDFYGVHFKHNWPSGSKDISSQDLWKGSATSAWISHIDRVFYSLEGTAGDYTLYRRQCWGNLDSTDSDWPNIGSTAMTSADAPTGCTVPDFGTGWEVLQRHIKNLTFRYFRDDATELTGGWNAQKAAETRLIQVDLIVAAKMHNNRELQTRLSRRFFLKFRGGIIDDSVSHSQGGCLDSGNIHECIWD